MGQCLEALTGKKKPQEDLGERYQATQSLINSNEQLSPPHENVFSTQQQRQEIPQHCSRLDDYRRIRVIGESIYGKVFLVEQLQTGRCYALKAVRKDVISQKNMYNNLQVELEILKLAKSEYIVQFYESFQSHDRVYFVLEFLQGGELYTQMHIRRFSQSDAQFYTAEILMALAYLHGQDIIYRDLKPENVMIDMSGHIKLIDFGLSHRGSECKDYLGQVEYQAPEIILIAGHTKMSDYWSLGAVLYEMLVGTPPHFNSNTDILKKQRISGQLHIPSELSDEAGDLIRRLLINEPKLRLGFKGIQEIQQHAFFKGFNWQEIRTIIPPFIPKCDNEKDLRYFEEQMSTIEQSQIIFTDAPESYNNFSFKADI